MENVVSEYVYLYDQAGRRGYVLTSGTSFDNGLRVTHYGYNTRHEVTCAHVYPAGPESNPLGYDEDNDEIETEQRIYSYDPIGNRTASTPGIQPTTDYTTNSLNQYTLTANPLEEFTYDLDGNLQTTGDFKMEYDAENRLVSIPQEGGHRG